MLHPLRPPSAALVALFLTCPLAAQPQPLQSATTGSTPSSLDCRADLRTDRALDLLRRPTLWLASDSTTPAPQPNPLGALLLECPAGPQPCRWELPLTHCGALAIWGGLEAELQQLAGTPGSAALHPLWGEAQGASALAPFIPAARSTRQVLPMTMAWSLGTPIGDSVRFLQLELARGDSGAVRLQLDRLMALPLRRDADRIGRFSSWPDFQSALIELREGNRPPYSGPRGDLVEKARRLYMELWGSKALKDSVARAKWDEAQRWMAMAWSRYGLPAGPAGERLGAWVQEPAGLTLQDGRTLDWNLLADSLRSVGVQAVWAELRNPRAATWPTALEHLHPAASGKTSPIATAPTPPNSTHPDTLDLPAAFVQAMRARQIEPHGVARLFRLPVPWLLPDSAVADLARDRLLQEDPNGAPLPALSWCVAANREHELAVLEELVRRTPLQGLLIDGLQSESPQGDYQPACRAAFEQQLGRPVPDWPLSVLPDSALAADWSRWQTEQITQFVRELSGRLHAARPGLELAVAIFPDPYEARDWHAQDWRTWAGEKLFDTYAPRLYDSDPGRLEARVQNLKAQLPARMLPLISAWDPADWQSRMPLALQLDALARMRGAGADGSILFSLNEAWLRHDAAWVSLAAHTLPPTTAPAAATSANSVIAKPTAAQ